MEWKLEGGPVQRLYSRVKRLFGQGVFGNKLRKERLNPMRKNTVNKAHSYTHITGEEREEIAIGIELGHSKRRIARTLKRNVSTITRECSRNQPPSNKVKYRASQAHLRSQKRQKESHRRERLKSEATRHYVAEKLIIVSSCIIKNM